MGDARVGRLWMLGLEDWMLEQVDVDSGTGGLGHGAGGMKLEPVVIRTRLYLSRPC